MKFITAVAALISLTPVVLGLTINTPASVVQCQPVLISWSGGTPPYFLSLIPAGQVSAPALETFPTQNGTQLTWTVDQAGGASFNIALKDSTGAVAYTDIVTVQTSTDKTCIGGSSNISAPPNTGTGTTPANTASGKPASSSGGGSVPTPAPSSTSSSTSSSSGKNGDAASLTLSSFGIAGVIGAIAALF